MSIDSIVFDDNDTLEQKATKTVLLNAGNNDLKKQMERLKINYSKVQRGFKTIYVLRHKDFTNGRIEVIL
jgi:hypothetical protein